MGAPKKEYTKTGQLRSERAKEHMNMTTNVALSPWLRIADTIRNARSIKISVMIVITVCITCQATYNLRNEARILHRNSCQP